MADGRGHLLVYGNWSVFLQNKSLVVILPRRYVAFLFEQIFYLRFLYILTLHRSHTVLSFEDWYVHGFYVYFNTFMDQDILRKQKTVFSPCEEMKWRI